MRRRSPPGGPGDALVRRGRALRVLIRVGGDLPVLQRQDARVLAERLGIPRRDDDELICRSFTEKREHSLRALRAETVRRLVQKQHAAFAGKRAGERPKTPLLSGEAVRVYARRALEPEQSERFARILPRIPAGEAASTAARSAFSESVRSAKRSASSAAAHSRSQALRRASLQRAVFSPPMRISPREGVSRRASRCSSAVFPLPDAPVSTTRPVSGSVTFRQRSACTLFFPAEDSSAAFFIWIIERPILSLLYRAIIPFA